MINMKCTPAGGPWTAARSVPQYHRLQGIPYVLYSVDTLKSVPVHLNMVELMTPAMAVALLQFAAARYVLPEIWNAVKPMAPEGTISDILVKSYNINK